MHIAIAIVGFRNATDIVHCLEALEHSSHPDFEIVICENGGRPAYDALRAAIPAALKGGQNVCPILAPRNLGYAGGINLCVRETPAADAWWVLNPDTQPHPDAMASLIGRLKDGECDAVGGTLHFPNGLVQLHGGRWQPWLARGVSIGHGASLGEPVDPMQIERKQNYLSGASMMFGRRFLETVGFMREDYFLYCEEVEWCLRAMTLGMRLGFAPNALVLHRQGTTTGNPVEMTQRSRMPIYLNERNRILVTRDRSPARLPIAVMGAFIALLLRYGRRGAWRQLGYGLSGWMAGVRNKRGLPRWLPGE